MSVKSESPINREFLASMCDDDAEFEKELVEAFLAAMPTVLEQIRAGVSAADADAVRAGAHTLKGSSRAIGAELVGDVAESLEIEARQGNLGDAGERLRELEARCAEVDAYARITWT